MSLWLNKKEKEYLTELVRCDLDGVSGYMKHAVVITKEEHKRLLNKIKDCK